MFYQRVIFVRIHHSYRMWRDVIFVLSSRDSMTHPSSAFLQTQVDILIILERIMQSDDMRMIHHRLNLDLAIQLCPAIRDTQRNSIQNQHHRTSFQNSKTKTTNCICRAAGAHLGPLLTTPQHFMRHNFNRLSRIRSKYMVLGRLVQ